MSPSTASTSPAGSAVGQPGEHRSAGVDARHAEAALAAAGQRDRQAAGADAELEHGTRPGQIEQHGHGGRVDVGDVAVPVVVHVGEGVAVASSRRSPPSGRTVLVGGDANTGVAATLTPRPCGVGSVAAWPSPTSITRRRRRCAPTRSRRCCRSSTERFANPSGSHRFARDARRAVDEARDVVADVLGVPAGRGRVHRRRHRGRQHGRSPAVAHGGRRVPGRRAPRRAARRRASRRTSRRRRRHRSRRPRPARRCRSTPDVAAGQRDGGQQRGRHDHRHRRSVARSSVATRPDALLHTDAVQAPCWLDLRTIAPHVDLLSLSAHKFGGPKGVGVLTIRDGASVGTADRRRRTGARASQRHPQRRRHRRARRSRWRRPTRRAADNERLAALRDRLSTGSPGVSTACSRRCRAIARSPDRRTCASTGIESESLLYLLDEAGVCASAASACASGAMEPSHVLAAMGVDRSLRRRRAAPDARAHHHRRRRRPCRRRGRRRPSTDCDESGSDEGRVMKVMVAMSGGVDSSVAGALLVRDGHEVVGVTMRLWGGDSDTGLLLRDRRRRRPAGRPAARHRPPRVQLQRRLRRPRRRAVRARPRATAPRRTRASSATAPQVRPAAASGPTARLRRRRHRPPRPHRPSATVATRSSAAPTAPRTRATSCTCSTRRRWRARCSRSVPSTRPRSGASAAELGLRTAAKPDSQDVCFITSTGGRERFLGGAHPVPTRRRVVDTAGCTARRGRRRRDGHDRSATRHRPARAVARSGTSSTSTFPAAWSRSATTPICRSTAPTPCADGVGRRPVTGHVLVQCSAHGAPRLAPHPRARRRRHGRLGGAAAACRPGQSVVFYDLADRCVLGGATVAR